MRSGARADAGGGSICRDRDFDQGSYERSEQLREDNRDEVRLAVGPLSRTRKAERSQHALGIGPPVHDPIRYSFLLLLLLLLLLLVGG